MEVQDPIYGTHQIEEKVLIDLINSEPVQRLKEVYMSPSAFFVEERPPVSRYEHSIGVMLLLRKFDASIEEQIAGLLHDVPHTAFSHVADFVFDDENHEYHERFLEEIVYGSEIPEILEEHGYDTDYILDESNFGLLERESPRLCADRLDYSLRDLEGYFGYNMSKFIEGLKIEEGEYVFQNFNQAEEFGKKYIELDSTVYASALEVAIFELLADIIRKAFELDEITEEDLFTTDRELMEKLRAIDCEEIRMKFQLLDEGPEIETGAEEPDIDGSTKARAVDPPFIENGEKIQASERSKELKEAIKEHRENVNDGFKVKILN